MSDESAPQTRRCSRCGVEKPLQEFTRNRNRPLGRNYYCRVCEAAYQRAWRRRNRDRAREIARRWRRKAAMMGKRRRRDWFKVHNAACAIANFALRAGILPRKDRCEKCGIEARYARLYKHHPDYMRPLDVVWLCGPCHGALHGKVVE